MIAMKDTRQRAGYWCMNWCTAVAKTQNQKTIHLRALSLSVALSLTQKRTPLSGRTRLIMRPRSVGARTHGQRPNKTEAWTEDTTAPPCVCFCTRRSLVFGMHYIEAVGLQQVDVGGLTRRQFRQALRRALLRRIHKQVLLRRIRGRRSLLRRLHREYGRRTLRSNICRGCCTHEFGKNIWRRPRRRHRRLWRVSARR